MENQDSENYPPKRGKKDVKTLAIGESMILKKTTETKRLMGTSTTEQYLGLRYAGKPTESTFSIIVEQTVDSIYAASILVGTATTQSTQDRPSYQLYFPKDHKDLSHLLQQEDVGGELEVLDLQPTSIVLCYTQSALEEKLEH